MKKIIAAVIVFTILCATVVLLFSEALQLPPSPPPPFEHEYKSQICAEQVAETVKVTSMLNSITDKLNNLINESTKQNNCPICTSCPELPKTECDPCPQCPATSSVVGNFDSIFAAAQSLWKYENPIMNKNRANSIASKFSKLPDNAINFHEEEQKTFFKQSLKKYVDERNSLLGTYPFKDNFMYGAIDDTLLYSITRWTKKVIEIGSGWSTSTLNKALQKNGEEGKKGQHICIEPYRADDIKVTDITIIQKPLEEVDLNMFSTLESGDILFIDSSHVVVPYSDVVLEYAFILPILAKGVIVHIHDIFLPFDYPVEWMFGEIPRTYDEQWMLAAMLSGGNNWKILFSTFYMTRTNPDLFANFPTSGIPVPPDSFWMVRS